MMQELVVVQFIKMLRNLSHILDKGGEFAQTKKFSEEVLLQSRLAPDQFPLVRQVQIACDTAKTCAALLTDREIPLHEDNETTLAQLKQRIEQVVALLNSYSAHDLSSPQILEKRITRPRWEGKNLSGLEFAVQHAIPNLYFHVTTAYSILRSIGVDVGKKDFLGEMPYKK